MHIAATEIWSSSLYYVSLSYTALRVGSSKACECGACCRLPAWTSSATSRGWNRTSGSRRTRSRLTSRSAWPSGICSLGSVRVNDQTPCRIRLRDGSDSVTDQTPWRIRLRDGSDSVTDQTQWRIRLRDRSDSVTDQTQWRIRLSVGSDSVTDQTLWRIRLWVGSDSVSDRFVRGEGTRTGAHRQN